MATALISLGSNIGDRAATIGRAIDELGKIPDLRITAASSLQQTQPAGGPRAQEPFLNAAALLETDLPPAALLAALQDVERHLGRIRAERWGPRTIDLDLLLYDQLELETPELILPHPRMSFRRFVLDPAAEIAAEMVHPVCGNTIGGLLRHLHESPRAILLTSSTSRLLLLQAFGDIPRIRIVDHERHKLGTDYSDYARTISEWKGRNTERVAEAIARLQASEWMITDWWETQEWCVEECAEATKLEPEKYAITPPESILKLDSAPRSDLPRFKLVVINERSKDWLDLFCFHPAFRHVLRERHRGPCLRLANATAAVLRAEVLAAIAAME